VPKPYPDEFRNDVVRGARNREAGVTIEQVAKDFGVHPMTLTKWMRNGATGEGAKLSQPRAEGAELREAHGSGFGCSSRRMRFCGGRQRICRRRICREKVLPARERARRLGGPRDGGVSGS
jgi:transposase